jgi:hypothetical protein
MTMSRIQRPWPGTAIALAMLALVSALPAGHASASEAKDDFGLQLRLVETPQAKGRLGPAMTGIARIEVFVEAFRATRNIQLSVLRPDGSTWTVKGRRFTTGALDWSGPGGEPLEPQEPDATGPTIRAHGGMRTMIAVPLEGAAIHEIVVTATGVVDGEPVKTEGVLRVALGVPDIQPVDDGVHANFGLKGVN